MKRPPREAFAVFAVLFIVLYLIGGAGGIRQAQSRIKSWFSAPTPEQVSNAGPATPVAPVLPPQLPRERLGKKVWLSDPPSTSAVVVALSSIMLGTVLMMFFTGRSPPR